MILHVWPWRFYNIKVTETGFESLNYIHKTTPAALRLLSEHTAMEPGVGGRANEGTVPGAGGLGSLTKEGLGGESSVFRKVRSELLRPILGLLDPVEHLRISKMRKLQASPFGSATPVLGKPPWQNAPALEQGGNATRIISKITRKTVVSGHC